MTIHYTGATIDPNYAVDILGDHAPTANADSGVTVAEQPAVTIDALANDTDPDTQWMDQQYLGISEYTDWTSNDGNVHGSLQVIGNKFVFTANDTYFDTGDHTVSFQYKAVDQWGAESNWANVTITVHGLNTGNPV